MNSTLTKSFIVGTASILISSASIEASILSADDPVFGVGSITQDTDTGLDWLDISLSTSQSFDDVVAQTGIGGAFEGFRHATSSEVGALFVNLGLTIGGVVPDRGAAYRAAEALLGKTILLGGTAGIFDDGGAAGTVDMAHVFPSRFPPGSGSSIGGSPRSSATASSSVGHYLVRDRGAGHAQNPEPAGIIVWGGLALTVSVVAMRKRRRSLRKAAA